jgi:hypothetical protein
MNDAGLDLRLRQGVLALTGGADATGDWDAVMRSATTGRSPRRGFARGRYAAVAVAGAVVLGATFGTHDWIAQQFDAFRANGGIDVRGAVVVAHLRQHDGSPLEIAETIVPAYVDSNPLRSVPAQRCVAARPLPPADPIAAPEDPLSFAGEAFCTLLGTMSVAVVWQDDGSAAMLARRPDAAASIELRFGSSSWRPSSSDGQWVLFTLPAGSAPSPRDAFQVVALDAAGRPVATQRVGI